MQISARFAYSLPGPADRPLTPLELEVINAALILMARVQTEFYGYDLASHLEDANGAYRRTGFSNLYRTLDRLERRKLLKSRWDLSGLRPRRLYEVISEATTQLMAEPTGMAAPRMTPRLVIS